MQINIIELIKNGKIGDSLKSRGGQRYTYNRYVFIKTKPNTVQVYEGHTYTTIDKIIKSEVSRPACTLTLDKIIFNLTKNKKGYGSNYSTYQMASFFSLNFLFRCYVRWSYNQNIIEANNGTFTPFARMEFDWSGNLISKVPKHAQEEYNKWDRAIKDNRNRQARIRYAQKVAEREFDKYEKNNKLDEYPVENVFKITNAQKRSYAINAIGIEKVLKPYPTKVIDSEVIEGQGKYELIDIQLPSISVYEFGRSTITSPKWCLYLKMINQSTGEYHIEGVARKSDNQWNHIPEETVRGALAWRDGETPNRGWGNREKPYKWEYTKPVILT